MSLVLISELFGTAGWADAAGVPDAGSAFGGFGALRVLLLGAAAVTIVALTFRLRKSSNSAHAKTLA